MTRDTYYLEVSYRHGKPFAAYLTLRGSWNVKVGRSEKAGAGLVVDYDAGGLPIGVEITAPSVVSLQAVNELLARLHLQAVAKEELAPLLAR
jgi:hypothetical protein